ncbi:MAG: multiheme c-type cytochrome [Kiritimatiellia bacterium]
MTRAALPHPQALIRIALLAGGLAAPAHAGERAFPPSRLAGAGGELLDPGDLFGAGDCAECHKTQERDWRGSMHSRAHHDGLYRAFAELARKEAGEETYLFCTACHAPGAVAAGEQPAAKDGAGKHTFLTDEGVTCEVCHLASDVRTVHAGGGGNASLLLTPGEARFGPLKDPSDEASHKNAPSPLHERSEFCSACHTLLHPHNGLVIENTYEEWRKGPYAAAGIQCQDCHMRTVEQAQRVAKTMKPAACPGSPRKA